MLKRRAQNGGGRKMVDLFGGLFDLNRDGKISSIEEALEMVVVLEEDEFNLDEEEDEDEEDD